MLFTVCRCLLVVVCMLLSSVRCQVCCVLFVVVWLCWSMFVVVGCLSLCVVCCLVFAVWRRALFVVRCALFVVSCALAVAGCRSVFVDVRCLLAVVCYALFAVRRLLFNVFFVVCCLLLFWCALFGVGCALVAGDWLLFVGYLVFVGCRCAVFVVCLLLCAACRC